ncbi:hypothetical protein [Plantactinospora sp. GCM10030261]|uniref:hypothetical protein n=1 Tax=Plantactinospora sp. GCM10030261 TaxID=3273420 RepID=UPI0036715452
MPPAPCQRNLVESWPFGAGKSGGPAGQAEGQARGDQQHPERLSGAGQLRLGWLTVPPAWRPNGTWCSNCPPAPMTRHWLLSRGPRSRSGAAERAAPAPVRAAGLVLGYAAGPPDDMDHAVARLAALPGWPGWRVGRVA